MFRNHEVAIQTLGLEATIRKDFVQDYCHTDVYFPQKVGSAPVYIERIVGNRRMFLKSCGEGKGPNNNPELLEFNIACRLLLEDSKYDIWEDKTNQCYSSLKRIYLYLLIIIAVIIPVEKYYSRTMTIKRNF